MVYLEKNYLNWVILKEYWIELFKGFDFCILYDLVIYVIIYKEFGNLILCFNISIFGVFNFDVLKCFKEE